MSAGPSPPTVTPISAMVSSKKAAVSMVPPKLSERPCLRLGGWLRHPHCRRGYTAGRRRTAFSSGTVAPPTGLEPATAGVETRSSIQLSYRGTTKGRPVGVGPDTLALRFGPTVEASLRASGIGVVGVAQLVRAPGCGPGGRGFESPRSPVGLFFAIRAPLAQLVEHRTLNPQVLGSSPRGCTTQNPRSEQVFCSPGVLSFWCDLRPWSHGGHNRSRNASILGPRSPLIANEVRFLAGAGLGRSISDSCRIHRLVPK